LFIINGLFEMRYRILANPEVDTEIPLSIRCGRA